MRSVVLAFALLAASALAQAQQPRALTTGQKEARCGALIVLDATASEGVGRLDEEYQVRRAVYRPHPFMSVALEKALPKIPEQFRDLI